MAVKFTSKAYWPKGTIASFVSPVGANLEEDITVDVHYDREIALKVCLALKKTGFAGESRIFPVKVELIEEF